MTRILYAVSITTWVALAGAVTGIVLLVFKRPALARRIAKRATLLSLVILGVAVAELQVLWSAPGREAPLLLRALPPGDPSVRARALAEGISAIMNCSALAIVAAVLGGIGWVVARAQLRRSAAGGAK